MGRHVFGCDICQDVCPWNRTSPRTQLVEFQPRKFAAGESESEPGSLYLPDLLKIANLSREKFQKTFRGSPVKRTNGRAWYGTHALRLAMRQSRPERHSIAKWRTRSNSCANPTI